MEAYELFLEAREQLRSLIVVTEAWDARVTRAIAIEGEVPALVAVAPDEPWGYGVLGYAAFERGEQVQAITAFQQAISRDSTDTQSRFFQAIALAYAGMVDESIAVTRQLIAVDPLAPVALLMDSIKSWFIGGLAESMPAVHRAMAADPDNLLMRWTLAYGLTSLGDLDGAQREVDAMRAAAADMPYALQADALLRAERGDTAGARALVEGLDLTPFDSHLTFHFAEVFAVLGEFDRALEVMALGIRTGFFPLAYFRTHCRFIAALRTHPGFEALMAEAEWGCFSILLM